MTSAQGTGPNDLDSLAERCCEENAKFLRGDKDHSDPRFCLEVWRCALHQRSSAAWQHLIVCFSPFMARKLASRSLGRVVIRLRSRSASPREAERSIIEDAFAQVAMRNQRSQLEIRDLGGLVDYLWMCAENLMRMETRPAKRHPVDPIPGGDDPPEGVEPPRKLEEHIEDRATLAKAAMVLRGCARDDREYQAGRLLIFLQYTEQELTKSPQYRGAFPNVHELHRIKARLMKCLREHLEVERRV